MTDRIDPIPREARRFQGRRAGLVTRVVAAVIDIAVVAVILLVGYFGLSAVLFLASPGRFEFPTPPVWFDLAAGYVVTTLYLTLTWHGEGRSYGYHVMGLRLVDRHDATPGLVSAFLRAAFYVAVPFGLLWVAISRANRSVQDVVLRTSVVYDWDVRPRSRDHKQPVVKPAEETGGSAPTDPLRSA